jgi:hypothetical protein
MNAEAAARRSQQCAQMYTARQREVALALGEGEDVPDAAFLVHVRRAGLLSLDSSF